MREWMFAHIQRVVGVVSGCLPSGLALCVSLYDRLFFTHDRRRLYVRAYG